MEIKAIGYHAGWLFFLNLKKQVVATPKDQLGSPDVLLCLACGDDAFLEAVYPLTSSAGTLLGWSARCWRGHLLREIEDAGLLAADKVPQAHYIVARGLSGVLELPPMPAYGRPVPSTLAASGTGLDMTPPQAAAVERAA